MKAKNSKKIKKPKKKIAKSKIVKDPNRKPQWKKVKLSGNLLSDEGGIGLEGLLGLEVLENPSESVRVTREKIVKVKKSPKVPAAKNSDDDDDDGSDTERSRRSKNERKKQKKLLKKAQEKKAAKMNGAKPNEPGKFVRPLPENDDDAGNEKSPVKSNEKSPSNKKKKGKKAKPSKFSGPNAKTDDEPLLSMDDLIVRFFFQRF